MLLGSSFFFLRWNFSWSTYILAVCKSKRVLFQVQVGPGAEKREGPKERSTFWHPAHSALCATERTAAHGASCTATQPRKRKMYRTWYNHLYTSNCGVFPLIMAWFFTAESECPGLWEGPGRRFRRQNSRGFTHVSTWDYYHVFIITLPSHYLFTFSPPPPSFSKALVWMWRCKGMGKQICDHFKFMYTDNYLLLIGEMGKAECGAFPIKRTVIMMSFVVLSRRNQCWSWASCPSALSVNRRSLLRGLRYTSRAWMNRLLALKCLQFLG